MPGRRRSAVLAACSLALAAQTAQAQAPADPAAAAVALSAAPALTPQELEGAIAVGRQQKRPMGVRAGLAAPGFGGSLLRASAEQTGGRYYAAELFGVTQPRISDLARGRIELFSIDALVNMLARAGLAVQLRVRPVAA